MPKVFVPCRQAMTVGKAKKFGEVVYLHDQSDPAKRASPLGLEPDRIFMKFARPLNTHEPDDMILLDGPLVYNVVAGSILACLTNKLKFLIWDQENRDYQIRSVLLSSVRSARKRDRRKRPNVYIPGNAHSYESAKKYGEHIEISTAARPIDPTKTLECLSPSLKESLRNDFLILSGDKLSNTISSIILSRRHGFVNYLVVHHRLKRYLARSVEFSRDRIRKTVKT